MTRIAFIGAGKMAEAIIARQTDPSSIIVSDIDVKRLELLKKHYHINVAKNNLAACKFAEVVFLSVKPQQVSLVIDELGEVGLEKIIISIAAGITLEYLEKRMKNAKIIRAMPNNPCLIGKGMIALSKGHNVVSDDLHVAEAIFKKVGEIEIVPEKWMDAVTGLSGSGPAFVYQAVEALVCGGVNAGLPEEVAVRLALHTLIGAAETVKITNKTPKELIKMVASPGGTTIEGLKILEEMGFSKALSSAVVAAAKKSKNLSLHGS